MHRFHQLMKNTVFHPRLVESIDVKLGGYRELIVYLLKKKKNYVYVDPYRFIPCCSELTVFQKNLMFSAAEIGTT